MGQKTGGGIAPPAPLALPALKMHPGLRGGSGGNPLSWQVETPVNISNISEQYVAEFVLSNRRQNSNKAKRL